MVYDLICIGAGAAGLYVSVALHKFGLKVLMIDKSDEHIGGECLNTGCVPSKALLHIAKQIKVSRQAQEYLKSAEDAADVRADWGRVLNYIKTRQAKIRAHETALWQEGIDLRFGEAKFVDKNTVAVKDQHFKGRRILIATGSRPFVPVNIKGLEKVAFLTNENIFKQSRMPSRLLILGAGATGVEFAQAFARLGVKVALVEKASQVLPKMPEEVGDILQSQLEQEGIKIYLNSEMKEIIPAKDSSAFVAYTEDKQKQINEIHFDQILLATGRSPNLERLQLDKAGIKLRKDRLLLNAYLRTSNPKVFACGDVTGYPAFSHGAELQANILLHNFLFPLKKRLSYKYFPQVIFSDPEVVAFGKTEAELKSQKKFFRVLEQSFAQDDRAIIEGYEYGKLWLYLGRFGKILGGHLIAPNAGEISQELILANQLGLSGRHFFRKIYAYPTASRINKSPFVEQFLANITPQLKQWLRRLYRL